ncbi:YciI family protein [Streptomyces sp. FXJ1.172]|uniref:YciI family protein n=1 Tax=Streptomyces sp. FXJ1.172 TaxID=710705 RepID=UPI000AD7DFB3
MGVFVAAGPENPREGGVVLAVAQDRALTEEIVAGDPFAVGGAGTYRVTESVATRTAAEPARHRRTAA